MKISVFTSNQPRHIHLVNKLATVCDEVIAVLECNSVFPWSTPTMNVESKSPLIHLHEYFQHVIHAEKCVFGSTKFVSANVRVLALRMGDLNSLPMELLAPALDADQIVVFGASYIKGKVVEALIERKAINIHMGVSPYYRGNGTNFWPLYDNRPDLVGATVHLLSKGIDSGAILFHAAPKAEEIDPFLLGMKAVKVAHDAVTEKIHSGVLSEMQGVPQDKQNEIRYTRASHFTDAIAEEYLGRIPKPAQILAGLEKRSKGDFISLYTA